MIETIRAQSISRRAVILAALLMSVPSVTESIAGSPLATKRFETLRSGSVAAFKPGTVTDIIFVAHWCGSPCEKEMGEVRRILGKHRRAGFRVILVGVSDRQSKEQFEKWASRFRLGAPLVHDASGAIEKEFGAELLPWHVVIGPRGDLLYKGAEVPSDAQIQRFLGRRP